MPTYIYNCEQCGFSYERLMTIADRHTPESEPCQHCGVVSTVLSPAAPMVSYTTIGVRQRTPEAFKDVLRNIKKKHAHSNIDV